MSYYVDEFRAKVRTAHETNGATCHWTQTDKFDAHAKGPCDCPSPGSGACAAHHGLKCYETSAVLSIDTQAESQYNAALNHLLIEMQALSDAIRSGNELLQKDPTYAEEGHWWDPENVLTNVMRGNAPAIRRAGEYICGINLPAPTEKEPKEKWIDCDCRTNKKARIASLQKDIQTLAQVVTDNNDTIKNDLASSKWPSLADLEKILETIEKALEAASIVVEGLTPFGAALLVVGVAAGPLTKKLTPAPASPSDGYKLLELAETVAWLGRLKIVIMLETIYLNQQIKAFTCISPEAAEKGANPKAATVPKKPMD